MNLNLILITFKMDQFFKINYNNNNNQLNKVIIHSLHVKMKLSLKVITIIFVLIAKEVNIYYKKRKRYLKLRDIMNTHHLKSIFHYFVNISLQLNI